MRLLGEEEIPYDAVWPASSLWLSVGDTGHRIKHAESVSITPVVFGIRKSLAEELGFTGGEVSVNDLLQAIQSGKLRFCMTSATQSNSGASAYIGFLYALLGNPEVITEEDLQSESLKTQMQEPVSYTHLDVYKRQSPWRRPWMNRPCATPSRSFWTVFGRETDGKADEKIVREHPGQVLHGLSPQPGAEKCLRQ